MQARKMRHERVRGAETFRMICDAALYAHMKSGCPPQLQPLSVASAADELRAQRGAHDGLEADCQHGMPQALTSRRDGLPRSAVARRIVIAAVQARTVSAARCLRRPLHGAVSACGLLVTS